MQEFYQKTAWENEPSANSPINEDNLNNIEDGIGELDSRVATLSNTKSNVDWVQMQTDGKKIAEVTIDGVKKNVYVPRGTGGSGGASSWEELEEKPFETLDNNNFNVSSGILSIKDKASGVEVSAIKESLIQFKDDGFLPKNLFDGTVNKGLWIVNNVVTSNASGQYVIVACEGGKTYTVSKKNLGLLWIASTVEYPAPNVNILDVQRGGSSNTKVATITTSASAKYLLIEFGAGGTIEPSTYEELMIEEGTEATQYVPYAISNQGLTQIVEEQKESLIQFKDDGFLPKNLLNKSADRIGIGMADDGTENTNGNAEMTEYIEVLPNRTYTISWLRTDTNMATRVALYDESKAFISLPIRDVRTEVSAQRYFATFNTTSNTKYLRANFSKAHKDVQIEEGTVATSYQTYAPSNIELKQSLAQLATTVAFSSNNAFAFVKIGRMVVMQLASPSAISYGDDMIVGICPDGYRPFGEAIQITKIFNGAYVECQIRVNNSGQIYVQQLNGQKIENAQFSFLKTKQLSYISA